MSCSPTRSSVTCTMRVSFTSRFLLVVLLCGNEDTAEMRVWGDDGGGEDSKVMRRGSPRLSWNSSRFRVRQDVQESEILEESQKPW